MGEVYRKTVFIYIKLGNCFIYKQRNGTKVH